MVNFTCNTCGDSLRKKDVTVHFGRNGKCKHSASLTCIDCLKVFGHDYADHTICVSEDQRYSANGLSGIQKSKTQIRNDQVCQHLQSVMTSRGSTLSSGVKAIIQFSIKNGNIPRKQKGFLNFIGNARRFNEVDANTVWALINEVTSEGTNQPKVDKPVKDNSGSEGIDSNGVKESGDEGNDLKKKKDESSEQTEINSESNSILNNGNGIAEKTKKKKKKSKVAENSTDPNKSPEKPPNTSDAALDNSNNLEGSEEKAAPEVRNGEDAMDVEEQNGSGEAVVESKKQKKLKKKREKYEAEMRALENTAAHNEDETNEDVEPSTEQDGKKKKSKKLKAVLDANDDAAAPKGKKKRQRTESMVAEADQPKKKTKGKENDENAEPVEEENGVELSAGQKDFKWADVIIQVLQAQDDKEMSIKRLCKKVVNEYLASLLEGTHVDEVKATAKFQKKLHKTPGVFVHKDKAKLKSTD